MFYRLLLFSRYVLILTGKIPEACRFFVLCDIGQQSSTGNQSTEGTNKPQGSPSLLMMKRLQVSSVSSSCLPRVQAGSLYRILTARLVSSMVAWRLYYCSSILQGLPAEQTARLQKVQNCAARLVMRKSKREHVTPLLKELHWLPVKFRIQYKIATIVPPL